MSESSIARNSNNDSDDGRQEYPQQLKNDAVASFALCTMKNTVQQRDLPPAQIQQRLNIGECSDAYDRYLTVTDVNDSQNRLNIRKDFAKEVFEPMLRENESLQTGIKVTTYNLEGKGYVMKFKKWSAGKSTVLNGGWNEFVSDHKLVAEDHVKLWMFRQRETEKLCFLIIRTEKANATNNASTQPKMSARKFASSSAMAATMKKGG